MARTPRSEQPEERELPPEPRDATTAERALWDVPNATFVAVDLSDAELEAGLAAGQYQEHGSRFLVNGLGEPAPPLAVVATPDAADPLKVGFAISGGSPGMAAVTLYYGDGTMERRDGTAGTDLAHTYAHPGTYSILVINDYGQEAHQVVTLEPAEVEPPPEAPPVEINNALPEPETPAA